MDADVALLQEAGRPPTEVADVVEFGQGDPWLRGEFDRWPLVVRLSDRVRVEWLTPTNPATETKEGEIAVSDIGTIAAARVVPLDGADPFIAVSMYSRWLNPHPSTGSSWIYSDASAHRIISDLSTFIGHVNPYKHRILAAGDLNILHGYGLGGSPYWAARDRTVFDRMESLKLSFVGPQAPHGRQADPVARPHAARQQERSYLLPYSYSKTTIRNLSARLRLRLPRLPRERGGAGPQLSRGMGPQRSLPTGNPGLIEAGAVRASPSAPAPDSRPTLPCPR